MAEAYWHSDISDADPPYRCRYPLLNCFFTETHVRQLEREGIVVLEGANAVLRDSALTCARTDVISMMSSGRFARSSNDDDVRQDLVSWVRQTDGTINAPAPCDRLLEPLGDGIMHCTKLVRGVADILESHDYQGSYDHPVPQQMQLAWYPGDSRSEYVRHLDTCLSSILEMGLLGWLRASDYRARSVTVILYLNDPDWQDKLDASHTSGHEKCDEGGSGGALRIYKPKRGDNEDEYGVYSASSDESEYIDVAPRGGTLVVFDSRRIEHQVLPTAKDRFALTCWIAGKQGHRPLAQQS